MAGWEKFQRFTIKDDRLVDVIGPVPLLKLGDKGNGNPPVNASVQLANIRLFRRPPCGQKENHDDCPARRRCGRGCGGHHRHGCCGCDVESAAVGGGGIDDAGAEAPGGYEGFGKDMALFDVDYEREGGGVGVSLQQDAGCHGRGCRESDEQKRGRIGAGASGSDAVERGASGPACRCWFRPTRQTPAGTTHASATPSKCRILDLSLQPIQDAIKHLETYPDATDMRVRKTLDVRDVGCT